MAAFILIPRKLSPGQWGWPPSFLPISPLSLESCWALKLQWQTLFGNGSTRRIMLEWTMETGMPLLDRLQWTSLKVILLQSLQLSAFLSFWEESSRLASTKWVEAGSSSQIRWSTGLPLQPLESPILSACAWVRSREESLFMTRIRRKLENLPLLPKKPSNRLLLAEWLYLLKFSGFLLSL